MLEIPRAPVSPDEISLAIGIMGPDNERLKAVSGALAEHHSVRVTEFASYPPKLDDLPQKLAQTYDVLMVDVDSDPDYAFGIVELLCSAERNYVMAYSEHADMKLAVRFMRAGVREFFTLPVDATELTNALKQAAAYRAAAPPEEKTGNGKLFVFLGTKGGCGVTTLASNFALALAQESDRKTLLIDLGLPLGDAAIKSGHGERVLYCRRLAECRPAGWQHACDAGRKARFRSGHPGITERVFGKLARHRCHR